MSDIFKFDCNGRCSPAYTCDMPGDNSGSYIKLSDFKQLQQQNRELAARVARLEAIAGECVGPLSYIEPEIAEEAQAALNESPQASLAEIEAATGKAGFIAGANQYYLGPHMKPHVEENAEKYAQSLRGKE